MPQDIKQHVNFFLTFTFKETVRITYFQYAGIGNLITNRTTRAMDNSDIIIIIQVERFASTTSIINCKHNINIYNLFTSNLYLYFTQNKQAYMYVHIMLNTLFTYLQNKMLKLNI